MITADNLKASIIPILAKYPVCRAAFFGSYARSEQHGDSDIDILLEFSKPIGLRYGSLYLDLKEALPVPVGLMTRTGLDEQPCDFRDSVLRDLEVFYDLPKNRLPAGYNARHY
jgi:predicted nucleotidyltransferase